MFIKLSKVSKEYAKYSKNQKGFYYPTIKFHFNFHNVLENSRLIGSRYNIESYGFRDKQVYNNNEEKLSWAGVADNEEQVYEYYKDLKDSNRKFVVSLTPVYKKYCGNWRWHKWGRYIGNQNRTAEYLAWEKDIDLIYCFHLYEILD